MAKRATGNVLTKIARREKRGYVTPEDVSRALLTSPPDRVRLDLLGVIAGNARMGCEDLSLCAFIAHRGTPTDGGGS